MVAARLMASLGSFLLALFGSAAIAAAEPSGARYDPASGHLVAAPFARFLEHHGGDFLGRPLTEAFVEQGRLVQWFERGRLETGGDRVELARLGLESRHGEVVPGNPQPIDLPPFLAYFPETGHVVGFSLLEFYRAHGGPAVLGLPITPQIGNVQWFERARLEWDPATGLVRLGDLGREEVRRRGIDLEAHATQWVATHRAGTFRPDGEEALAVPAWRAFLVLGQEDHWLRVWDPLTDRLGLIEPTAIGPISPPAWHEWLPSIKHFDGIGGRVIRRGTVIPESDNLQHNQPVTILASLSDASGGTHYLTAGGDVLSEPAVRLPRQPERTFPGKWIDVDLREPVLVTAYEGDRPVYSALAVKGVAAYSTPVGVFRIWRRVENETMDSATIGIPRNASGGYYLTGVLFTQYFTTGGAALHYNYWRSDWGYPGSHGCLGMNYADSKWFWDWAEVGTVVYVRE